MKLIEAMKKSGELLKKAEDLRAKVQNHHADMDFETPVYGSDQKKKIDEWLQGHSDILKEVARLKTSIQRTNLETKVDIEIDGKMVTKSIAEWILRRKDLAKLDQDMWAKLNDKGLREGVAKTTAGLEQPIKIRRYYDPTTRDKMLDIYRNEPSLIDRTLEVVNAVTDLIEK